MNTKCLIVIFLSLISFQNFAQKHKNLTQTVQFSQGGNDILPEEAALLKVFIDMIRQMPDYSFMIQAQTSNINSPSLLSSAQNRAKQVKEFIEFHGIPSAKISLLETTQSLPEDDTENAQQRKYQVLVFGYFVEEEAIPVAITQTISQNLINTKTTPKTDLVVEKAIDKEYINTTKIDNRQDNNINIPEATFSFQPPKKASEAHAEWEKIESENQIELSYPLWDIEPQTFIIYPEKDTLLETIRGLFIYVPAYVFQTKGVQTMGREIHFIVREYLKKSDMAAFYIGSQNENQHISPYGIYRIEMTSDDNPLEIKPNRQIYCMFPQVFCGPDVQFYAGTRIDSSFQLIWEKQTHEKGSIRTQIPVEWTESWKGGWLKSEEKKEENFIAYIRKRYRLTKEQAQVLAYTMISQDEYQDNPKKWEKEGAYPIVHPSSAYIFGISDADKSILFGKENQKMPEALVRVEYPQKKNVAFQLVSKKDKTVSYPTFAATDDNYTFQAYKEEEYVLLGVKYIHNKVQLSMQSFKVSNNQMEVKDVKFSDYDDFRDAQKALRALDY